MWKTWTETCLMACLTWPETNPKCRNEFGENKINWSIKRKKLLLHYRLHKIFTAAWRILNLSRHWFANAEVKLNTVGISSSFDTFLPLLFFKFFVVSSPSNTLFLGLMWVFSTGCGRTQAYKNICVLKDCMEETCGRQGQPSHCKSKMGSVPSQT